MFSCWIWDILLLVMYNYHQAESTLFVGRGPRKKRGQHCTALGLYCILPKSSAKLSGESYQICPGGSVARSRSWSSRHGGCKCGHCRGGGTWSLCRFVFSSIASYPSLSATFMVPLNSVPIKGSFRYRSTEAWQAITYSELPICHFSVWKGGGI